MTDNSARMNFDGAYPPGVTGKMIDEMLDPVEFPECCMTCTFYEDRTCGNICSLLETAYENAHEAGALDKLTDDEYMQKFGKKPDDYCTDYERWED